jgi:hypothetical protein
MDLLIGLQKRSMPLEQHYTTISPKEVFLNIDFGNWSLSGLGKKVIDYLRFKDTKQITIGYRSLW